MTFDAVMLFLFQSPLCPSFISPMMKEQKIIIYTIQGLFQSFSQGGGSNGRGFDLKGGQLLIIIFICNVNFDVF